MEGGRREGAADAMVSDVDAHKENVVRSSFASFCIKGGWKLHPKRTFLWRRAVVHLHGNVQCSWCAIEWVKRFTTVRYICK